MLTKLSGRVLGLKVLVDWILLSVTGLDVLACKQWPCCLFDDSVEGNDHRDDDCKDYDDDGISNAGDVSVAVDVVNILAMALCR